eukprot:TRINITY_DN8665_c0_g1_i1.p1 TRINITY_DN8665_c0_g1~~TRINITY_DN8665_c0_g1_i1.p1  ORF type:complete len:410 (-),score=105.90 TRINITY_DN8665_c0_g1_i1:168-1262(-)
MATAPLPNSSQSNRGNLLRVTPKELVFAPPFNRVVTNTLRLGNMSSDASVAYKVKTTAPQRYCVRPNTGVILPLETAEITVSVNLSNPKEVLPAEGKDRFQIQAIKIIQPYGDIKEVWSRASEDDIKKQKLKAVFLIPSSSTPSTPSNPSHLSTNNAPVITDLSTQPSATTLPPAITLITPQNINSPPLNNSTPSNASSSALMESSLTSSVLENSTTFSSFTTLPTEYHQASSAPPTPSTPVVLDNQPSMRKILDEMNEKLSTVSTERDTLFKQILLLNQQISQLKEISLHQKEEEEVHSSIRHRKVVAQAPPITSSFIRDPTVALTYSFRGFPVIIVHKGEEVQFLMLIFIVFLVSFLLGLML